MQSFWSKHWALIGALSWVVSMAAVVGIVQYLNDDADDFRSMSRRGTATLVGFTQSNDRDRRYRPTVRRFEVYEFQPEDGQVVRFSSPILGADTPRQLGQSVPIQYPAYAPQTARLIDDGLPRATRLTFWVVPLGTLFALPFLIIWFKGRRQAL